MQTRFSNGDDMELAEEEFADYYAATVAARASQLGQLLLAHSSAAVVGLVVLFGALASALVAVISYKHYRARGFKGARVGSGRSSGGSGGAASGSASASASASGSASTISQSSVSSIEEMEKKSSCEVCTLLTFLSGGG